MKIAVIGAGNGGQAIAGHFASLGHSVSLYNRTLNKLGSLNKNKEITLTGAIKSIAKLEAVTDKVVDVIVGAKLIMVATTADAHESIAREVAPYVEDDQIIVLNPGRTLGALEFSNELRRITNKRVYIAEAQSLLYACRIISPGHVNVIGVKESVLFSAYPSKDTDHVLSVLNSIYSCFKKVDNILVSGLENIGAILHPAIVLLNSGAIDRGENFGFYSDISPSVARFLKSVDQERLDIGESFGIPLHSVFEWIALAYANVNGDDLYTRMISNPAYNNIQAPTVLDSRYLREDIPTGVVPMIELARMKGIKTPLMNSIVAISEALLGRDLKASGRTLEKLNIRTEADLKREL